MEAELFAAFRAINVPAEKARRAAVALSHRDQDVGALKRDVEVRQWMVGALHPLIVAILLKLFVH